MNILSLSGWSQRADTLSGIVPNAEPLDYGGLDSLDALYAALREAKPDAVVGWSLGGQLAIRAIASGVIAPARLVLLATPYQCAATAEFPDAVAPEDLATSRAAFMLNPDAMLRQFYTLCTIGDSGQKSLQANLFESRDLPSGNHWLHWFDELVAFSCRYIDFSSFPATTLIYGGADRIVPLAQGEEFARRMPQARLHVLPDCAHAPHLHDAAAVKRIVEEAL